MEVFMQSILEPLAELKEFQEIQKNIENNISPVQVTGCMDSQKSHLIAGLGKKYPYKVIIAANDIKAKEIKVTYNYNYSGGAKRWNSKNCNHDYSKHRVHYA